jgi:molybdopterin-binding protein
MNKIEATIKEIEGSDIVHVVTFAAKDEELTMMALELPSGVKEGVSVTLGIKPSFVLIAKKKSKSISLTNQIDAKIVDIVCGKLLVTVKLASSVGTFESLITKKSYDMMGLHVGQDVVVMMKASEISIIKVSDAI